MNGVHKILKPDPLSVLVDMADPLSAVWEAARELRGWKVAWAEGLDGGHGGVCVFECHLPPGARFTTDSGDVRSDVLEFGRVGRWERAGADSVRFCPLSAAEHGRCRSGFIPEWAPEGEVPPQIEYTPGARLVDAFLAGAAAGSPRWRKNRGLWMCALPGPSILSCDIQAGGAPGLRVFDAEGALIEVDPASALRDAVSLR